VTPLRFVRHQGVEYLAAAGDGWSACFSTRIGGVSRPPFAELNTSLTVGDSACDVLENRARLAAAAGFDAAALVVGRQVHGVTVTAVTAVHAGRGAQTQDDALPDTDALLTDTPEVPLLVSTADCVPVVLAACKGDAAAVAVVHAGWRGMLQGIVEHAARRLAAEHGQLTAGLVGPSIGPCCFTVGEEVGRSFDARFPGTWHDGRVDLWEAAARQLAAAGLAQDQVADSHICTVCDGRFFSHRRDAGRTGRQATVAWVTAPAAPARPSP